MRDAPLDITGFLKLVIEALESAGVEYLIGGAIAEWAWGEPRATQDLDLVINLPIESVGKFSKELEKRNMLVPLRLYWIRSWKTARIFRLMRSTSIVVSKRIYIRCVLVMNFVSAHFNGVNALTMVHRLGTYISMLRKI